MTASEPSSAPRKRATVRALAHPVRLLVLSEYALAVTSPSKIGRALGLPVNLVSYHTRVLLDAGLLELLRIEPRRGAHEHFYRTNRAADIEDADWAGVPAAMRRIVTRRALEVIWTEATEALPVGGMDDRRTHVSRSVLRLDDRGRTELATLLRQTLAAAAEIQRLPVRRPRSARGARDPAVRAVTRYCMHWSRFKAAKPRHRGR